MMSTNDFSCSLMSAYKYQKKEITFCPLLTISPPLDEKSFRATDQDAFIVDALSVYRKDKCNVLFGADNTNIMNHATARLLQVKDICV